MLFGESVKFVEVGSCRWINCDCETSFFGFLFPLSADEFFDGPDKRVENSPFDLLEDITHSSFIVELPWEKNTECKGACQDRKTIEDIEVDLRGDMESVNEPTKLLQTKVRADLPLLHRFFEDIRIDLPC